MDIQFNKSNGFDEFIKTRNHFTSNEAAELSNTYSQRTMDDRVRQQKGNADITQASGEVAMATREDNIAQERTATQQGRSNLRATNLSNIDREIDLTSEMAKRYEAGFEAEGDNIARQLGQDPNSPELQQLKKDREFWGMVSRATEEAKQQFGTAEKRQRFVESRIAGYVQGRTKANDYGAGYESDPSYPPRDTTQLMPGTSRSAGTRRPLLAEQKMAAWIAEGETPENARAYAYGVRKPPDDMKTRNLIERMVETERRGGFLDDSEIQTRRAELIREFGIGAPGAAPAAQGQAPAAPQASAPPPPAPMAGHDFNHITQGGPGGVNTSGYLPNGGNAQALESGLQQRGQSLLSQVDVPVDPTTAQAPSASQAATAPAPSGGGIPTVQHNGRTIYKPRTRQEAESLPSGTPFMDPKGNVLTKK